MTQSAQSLLQGVLASASAQNRPVAAGVVRGKVGLAIEVVGLRAAIGDLCEVRASSGGTVMAEVVGFRDDVTTLMTLGDQEGIAPADAVVNLRKPLTVRVGSSMLGRVVDALGRPIDGGPPLTGEERRVQADAPPAMSRSSITEPFATGVPAIDGMLTCGRGQRLGLFAGSGVGKSSLIGMIARGTNADINVIALIGERGREVRDFIDNVLGPEGLARSVVVVSTSDSPPMQRFKGPYTAVTIAEAFREQGANVLFMMDSVTRFAGAAREIGLAIGEPPTLRGYPPSLFAHMPRLVERLGNDGAGTITGLLTVLVDGDDLNEPVSDALRGYLDGHVVLDRKIAARGKFPAIDVLSSVSRLMPSIVGADHARSALTLREWLASYEESRDLIQVGAYRAGADPVLDVAIQKVPEIEKLLYCGSELSSFDTTVARMRDLCGPQLG